MPTELAVFDFDDTLFRSPRPPGLDPLWWYRAYSLEGPVHAPGRDARWMLPIVARAHQAIRQPTTLAVVLTARVDSRGMREQLHRILAIGELHFDAVQLKPLTPLMPSPAYKAAAVSAWLNRHPDIRRVTFYDDQQPNLDAVANTASSWGVEYVPVRT